MSRPLLCSLGWHAYRKVHTQVGTDAIPFYLRCERCGHERDFPSSPLPSVFTAR